MLAVWAPLAALFLCPWVSGAALTDRGEFAPPTALWLWVACLGVLTAGLAASAIFIWSAARQGRSPWRAARSLAGHTGLTGAILLVTLPLADLALAHVRPLPAAAHLDVPKAQLYGWAYDPGQTLEIINPDTKQVFSEKANSQGWRDAEHSGPKTRPRVLLLGDSVLFGVGVPLEQTLGRQLQRLLGDRAEVVAVGLPGWGTDQQLLFLDHEGWSYQPDLVVLLFTIANDVVDNLSDHWVMGTAPKPRFRLVDGRLQLQPLSPWRPSPLRRLFAHSTISRHLRFWLQLREANARRTNYGFRSGEAAGRQDSPAPGGPRYSGLAADENKLSIVCETWSPAFQEGWDLTLRLVEAIAAGCRDHGARFVFYSEGQVPREKEPGLFPESLSLEGKTYRLDWDKPFRLLKEFCGAKGIDYLEEPEAFRKDFWRGGLSFRNDPHPTALGNQRLAENIARLLAERNLLPPPNTPN